MATTTVLKFMQKTAEDETLRQQLEALLGVGDGNISSEAELDPSESDALKGERAPAVVEFAAKNGFQFSPDELVQVIDAFQKHQTGAISDKDFASLLGISNPTPETLEAISRVTKLKKWFTRTYFGY